ncbi:MAG: hypothetical protein ACKO24_10460, partial [Leptolyngbyaceae cyanobacterium]
RFPGMNSGLPDRTQNSVWFSPSFDWLSCLERVRYRFAVVFSSLSFRDADLTCWRHCNLKQFYCSKSQVPPYPPFIPSLSRS